MSGRRQSISSSNGPRQQNYYYQEGGPPAEYARSDVSMDDDDDDDDDEDTQIQTDVSAMPEAVGTARASFRRDPVSSQVNFDSSLPPDSITPARRLPSTSASRSSQVPYPSQTRPQIRTPTAAPRALPPPPPGQSSYSYAPAAQAPVSAERGVRWGNDQYEDEGGSESDSDDAFTAVGTGVATDLDFEDEPLSPGAGGNVPDAREQLWAQQQQRQAPSPLGRSQAADLNRRPSVARDRLSPDDPRNDPNYIAFLQFQRQQQQGGIPSRQDEQVRLAPIRSPLASSDDDRTPAGRVGGLQRFPSAANLMAYRSSIISGVSDTSSEGTITPINSQPSQRLPPLNRVVSKQALSSLPEDSPIERNLIRLLKSMNFSVALKDLHDTFGIGVSKTLVAEDGRGHAFVKVHCKRLLKHDDIKREPHLAKHWIPISGSRWEFRTVSHRVTIVWKSVVVGAHEMRAGR